MAKRRSSATRLALFLIVVIVLSIFLANQVGLLTSGPLAASADTTTHSYDYYGAYGGGATGNCLPSDAACSPNGNFLDADAYVASYTPNQIGQRSTAIGALLLKDECQAPFGSACVAIEVTEIQIQLAISYPGGSNIIVGNYTNAPNKQVVDLGKWYQEINTYWDIVAPDGKTIIPSGTILTAVLRAHVVWVLIGVLGPYNQDKGWGIVASDQANVITGIGTIGFTNAHSDANGGMYYITGETASFTATVGYVSQPGSTTAAWNVYIFSEAQNKVVFGPTSITQLTQSFSYKVQAADFSNASTNSELVLYLRNGVYGYAFQIPSVVRLEDVAHMPTCTQPTISPQSPQQGQTVTLSFSCTPASTASIDQIKLIKIEYGWGTIETTVTLAGSATSFSFTASQSGYVYVAITAYTNGNVPSGTQNLKIQIDHQVANTCSNGAPSCSQNPGGFIWIILLAIGVLSMAAAAFLPTDMKALKLKPFARVILAIVGFMALGFAYLVYPG